MPIPWPKSEQDEYQLSKSVMDRPRTKAEVLLDFLVGRTLPERMTNAFTGTPQLQLRILDPRVTGIVSQGKEILPRRIWDYLTKSEKQFNVVGSTGRKDTNAWYHPSSQTIYLNLDHPFPKSSSLPEAFAHEATHAAQYGIGKGSVAPSGVEASKRRIRELMDYYKFKIGWTPYNNVSERARELAYGEVLPEAVQGGVKNVDYKLTPELLSTLEEWWPKQ